MARLSAFWPALLVLGFFLPQVSAWTLLWRNDTIPSQIESGQSAQNCTRIWHQEDEQFSWDPEGPWCLDFFSDSTCQNSNGKTCEGYIWRQVATQNISAFRVYPMPPASVTAFGFASTSSTPTPTSTETPTPTNAGAEETPTSESGSADDNDNDLSGGAIAGIVVGVLVAVAILCAAFFYLGRRSGKKTAIAAATTSSTTPPSDPSPPHQNTNTNPLPASPPSEHPSSSPTVYAPAPNPAVAELPKPPVFESAPPYAPAPVTYIEPNEVRVVELPGQNPGAELSNTRQVQELEGRGMGKTDV
ncbi:hypothetical protein BDV12DRAFT_203549 [Aspergillus spectabilis]